MFTKTQIIDFILILILSTVVFLIGISQGFMGLWEPWETSTILAAQHIAHSSIVESSFWVPQVDGTLISQPYLELWALAALLQAYPEPNEFILRLPGSLIGIILIILSFFTVRQFSTRRTAWMCAGILLTMPMLVLSGKFIHGDIWLAFALAAPNLLYILACYASTRRMHRVMLSLSAISAVLSFLSGGLFACAILLLEGIFTSVLLYRNPLRKEIIRPMTTRYFLTPLYIAFVISASIFGIYVTQARYELEGRTPMTLVEINKALDEDRVITIERRDKQVIGSLRPSGKKESQSFILIESAENLNTNAAEIFSLSETEQRAFENYLMWRFQKKAPSRTDQPVPPIEDAFKAALQFFWYHTNTPIRQSNLPLARVNGAVLEQNPDYAHFRTESVLQSSDTPAFEYALVYAENALQVPVEVHDKELLRIINMPADYDWVEVQNGSGHKGFVHKSILTMPSKDAINWTSWLDILLYGLFPWSCFFPIIFVCALISPKHLAIAESPFRGEFIFTPVDKANGHRAPIQSLLLSWVLAAIIALIAGINNSRHFFFAAIIPVSVLLSLSLTSPSFWRRLRNSLEARIFLILTAFACLAVAIYALPSEPFRLVRYLLADPTMHWDSEHTAVFEENLNQIVAYIAIFAVLTIIALGGASDRIQEAITNWKNRWTEKSKSTSENRSSSYSSLIRISRGETEPIPYAPSISMILLGITAACFIYFDYLPSISNDFTEKDLTDHYFKLATASEPLYLVSGENKQLCQTYSDCEPGYICENSHCHISTFASYSLSVAHPISRTEMISALMPNSQVPNAFYVIPKDTMFSINQSFRSLFTPGERRNLKVLDAPSSRLYLIGSQESETSINPMDALLPEKLPATATALEIDLNDEISIAGFKLEKLDFERSHALDLTLYFRVKKIPSPTHQFIFNFDLGSRSLTMKRPILREYDVQKLLEGDLVAASLHFDLTAMPSHGLLDIKLNITENEPPAEMRLLTTVGF